MSKLEAAALRLDEAVARLERAVAALGDGAAEGERLASVLAEVKADYAALEQTTAHVASRLDATIERLDAVLRN